jgi:hypothetical protein
MNGTEAIGVEDVSPALPGTEQAPEAPLEGRDPRTGRFARGHTVTLKHGRDSARVARREVMVAGQRLFAETAAAARAELEAELGAGRPLGTLQKGLIRRYLEVDACASFLAHRMMAEGGPLTAKGSTRSYLEHFLKLVDRQAKLAGMLGLRAPEKHVIPPGGHLPPLEHYRAPDETDGEP